MKKLLTILMLAITAAGFAQIATSTGTTSATTKNSKYVATWYLTQTEVFNAPHAPTTAEANDKLVLTADGKYSLTYEGTTETGTWTADATYITLTNSSSVIRKFKVMECTSTTLKVDYKDETEIHNILYYSTAAPRASGK